MINVANFWTFLPKVVFHVEKQLLAIVSNCKARTMFTLREQTITGTVFCRLTWCVGMAGKFEGFQGVARKRFSPLDWADADMKS
jgi:hypothetical protein